MAVAASGPVRDAEDPPGHEPDFDTLRSILIGPERRQLQELQARFDDPIARGRDLGRALPQALRARQGDRELTDALLPPVERAITVSVRRNPGPLADALFPIMGPAIRKAVAASLASMMESVNRTLEHGFSARALRWRLTAWRTGRPFAEIVLLHTLLYRVEQVFLIDRRTGLLLQHVHGAGPAGHDPDLVSGMLTAIRDFVGDSFKVGEQDALDSLRVGDLTVVIEQGPRAFVAAVVRGTPPPDFRQSLQQALETVHLQHGDALEQFSGDAAPFESTRPTLESCVQAAYRGETGTRRRPLGWLLVGLLTLAAAGLVAWQIRERLRWQHYLQALAAEPGLVVVEAEAGWRTHRISGLRDALARDPQALLAGANLAPDRVVARWDPFLALDPAFVLIRARAALRPAAGVELTLSDGVLRVTGAPTASWLAETRRLVPLLAGVSGIDDRAAIDESARRAAGALAGPRLLFELATTDAVGDAAAVLSTWRAVLLEIDGLARLANRRVTVRIVGHSDELGLEGPNLELSRARAVWVGERLDRAGLAAIDFETMGVGSQDPIVTGQTGDDLQQNRRVALQVSDAVAAGHPDSGR